MVQFRILSGKRAGATWVARRFPVQIGRAGTADLQLEEDGVWDLHLLLEFNRAEGFIVSAQANALVRVNGQLVQQTTLRNGDVVEIGCLKLQFWLTETRQAGLGLRETLTWAGIAAVSLSQIALIYWLLR